MSSPNHHRSFTYQLTWPPHFLQHGKKSLAVVGSTAGKCSRIIRWVKGEKIIEILLSVLFPPISFCAGGNTKEFGFVPSASPERSSSCSPFQLEQWSSPDLLTVLQFANKTTWPVCQVLKTALLLTNETWHWRIIQKQTERRTPQKRSNSLETGPRLPLPVLLIWLFPFWHGWRWQVGHGGYRQLAERGPQLFPCS